MAKFLLGKKLGMSQFFDEKGNQIPITLIETGPGVDFGIFQPEEKVKVSGISKGKGFAGAVKKEGVHGKNKTHGTKHEERTTGSTGASQPSRVIKGIKMAGRLGHKRVTVSNLKIVKIDKENNIIAVRGAVPGPKGTLLEIKG